MMSSKIFNQNYAESPEKLCFLRLLAWMLENISKDCNRTLVRASAVKDYLTSFSVNVGKPTSDIGAFVQTVSFILTNMSNLQYAHFPASGSVGCIIF